MASLMSENSPKKHDFEFAGLQTPVQVRRHPSAKRISLRISHTRRAVILTMPKHCSFDDAGDFLNENIDWVLERLDQLPDAVPFADGVNVPVRGLLHEISFKGPLRRHEIVWTENREALPPLLCVTGDVAHASRRLKDWLSGQAKDDLSSRVLCHARNLGLSAKHITVRDQTTRWGSCSSRGHLSFSWRLVLAPSFVLDYVAAHEVAHLQEMNHGPRFWELVRMTMPRMDEARSWLKENGAKLHSYGALSD